MDCEVVRFGQMCPVDLWTNTFILDRFIDFIEWPTYVAWVIKGLKVNGF